MPRRIRPVYTPFDVTKVPPDPEQFRPTGPPVTMTFSWRPAPPPPAPFAIAFHLRPGEAVPAWVRALHTAYIQQTLASFALLFPDNDTFASEGRVIDITELQEGEDTVYTFHCLGYWSQTEEQR